MKNIKFMYSKITLLSGLLLIVMMSCERDITDQDRICTLSLKQVKYLQIHPLDSERIFTSHTQDQRKLLGQLTKAKAMKVLLPCDLMCQMKTILQEIMQELAL